MTAAVYAASLQSFTSTTEDTMQLGTALPTRIFELEKYGLVIRIKQITDARGAVYSFWGVTYGGRSIKTGVLENQHPITDVLKHIADITTMRTSGGDMLLRGLTWTALDGCEHAPASELCVGDRMVIGGTEAHTVASVADAGNDFLHVGFEGRMPTQKIRTTRLCNLIERGPRP